MHNAGKERLTTSSAQSGISQATAQYTSWGSGIYDFDNDGWLRHPHLPRRPHSPHPAGAFPFQGLGNGKFADVSRDAGPVLDVKSVARGACFADYDNDGKMDAFLVNLGARGTLLHNVTGEQSLDRHSAQGGEEEQSRRHRRASRSDAGGATQVAERVAGSGYLSQDDARVHFGLGTATKVDKLTVQWPSGKQQVMENLPADRVVDRGGAEVKRNLAHRDWLWRCSHFASRHRCGHVQSRVLQHRNREYLSPSEMAFSPDGARSTSSANAATNCASSIRRPAKSSARIPVGHVPRGLALSADGKQSLRCEFVGRHRLRNRPRDAPVVRTIADGR